MLLVFTSHSTISCLLAFSFIYSTCKCTLKFDYFLPLLYKPTLNHTHIHTPLLPHFLSFRPLQPQLRHITPQQFANTIRSIIMLAKKKKNTKNFQLGNEKTLCLGVGIKNYNDIIVVVRTQWLRRGTLILLFAY